MLAARNVKIKMIDGRDRAVLRFKLDTKITYDNSRLRLGVATCGLDAEALRGAVSRRDCHGRCSSVPRRAASFALLGFGDFLIHELLRGDAEAFKVRECFDCACNMLVVIFHSHELLCAVDICQ